ncbi:SO_0444 family Cu/Zn efflux transporter [Vibrio sp. WJH972]
MELVTTFFSSLLSLWLDAAFWIIFGLIVSGILKATLSSDKLGRHFRGSGPLPAIKAALMGIPLPLCSCGVIPAAVGLRRAGASKSATTAFLISTPETGVDSIAISYALLGPFMAVIRPIAATTSAITAAMLVLVSDKEETEKKSTSEKAASCCGSKQEKDTVVETPKTTASSNCCSSNKEKATLEATPQTAPSKTSSCCSSNKEKAIVEAVPQASPTKTSSCCSSKNEATAVNLVTATKPAASLNLASSPSSMGEIKSVKTEETLDEAVEKESWIQKLWQGQRFAFTNLITSLSMWLIIGLVMSALVVTFIPPETLADISRGPMAMFLMAIIGVPMYICASASTPLAAGFMLAGVSPGAVLVFLLAGPASNMATLGIVQKELGTRSLISYLVGVVGIAILFGYLTNFLVDHYGINIDTQLANGGEFVPSPLAWISGIVLAALIAWDLFKKYRARPSKPSPAPTSSCCKSKSA